MKLFQKLLLAPTAIGVLTPMAVSASEVNLQQVSSYSQSDIEISQETFKSLSSVNPLLAGGEGLNTSSINDTDVDTFSSTTTLDGKAVFVLGGVDGNDDLNDGGTERVSAAYVYQMNLNTSFNGDDNLYVRLKTGDGFENFVSKPGTYHNEANSSGSTLKVDKIWYTLPLGDKVTVTLGPKIENYYMLAATPSVYKPKVLKAFRFGGHGAAFGASTSTGVGLKYDAGNGFASSVTVNSKGAQGTDGFLTDQDTSKINVMAAYTADNYHLSATYTKQTGGFNAFHYFSTDNVDGSSEHTGYALRAWFRPDETGTAAPSISIGFDTMDLDQASSGYDKASGYSVALNWSDIFQADDTIGAAIGQPINGSNPGTGVSEDVNPLLWEAYYSFRPNDSIEITPGIFGGKDVRDDETDDIFGAVLTTTFKF